LPFVPFEALGVGDSLPAIVVEILLYIKKVGAPAPAAGGLSLLPFPLLVDASSPGLFSSPRYTVRRDPAAARPKFAVGFGGVSKLKNKSQREDLWKFR
jgi:hypothetical protein